MIAPGSGRVSDSWSVHLALAGAQTGFALFPIFGKLALATLPAFVLAASRVVCAALVLHFLSRLAGGRRLEPRDRPAIFLYALLGVSFNQVLFILGLSLTTAIHTVILTTTIPVFTLLAAVILRRESLTARAVAGVLLAGTGAALLLNIRSFDWHSRLALGNLVLIGNVISYSFYLVLSRKILSRYSALTVVSGVFSYGAVPIVLFSLPSIIRFQPSRVTPLSWGSLAAVVAFSTVIPYLATSWALARTAASRVALYVFLQPLLASFLAIVVLHETFTVRTAAAAGLILSGLAVSIAGPRLGGQALPEGAA